MLGRQKLPLTVTICLLLLATLIPSFEARRGGFGRSGGGGGWGRGWGGGGGQAYRPIQRSGSSAGKVAGAAAAGAIGGAMIGSALSRPGYGYGGGYGGYGGYGGGYGGYGGGYGGYGRGYGSPRGGIGDESGSGDMAFLSASTRSISNNIIVVIGSLMSLLVGRWLAVM